jgi:AcrR family transcriptional regulator
MTTEDKIRSCARRIFLLYGYYGTTVEKIAREAGVSKSMIHYYFRSKDKLYEQVIVGIAELLLTDSIKEHQDILLFIIKELQNNKVLFLNSLNAFLMLNWNDYLVALVKNTLAEIIPDEFVKIFEIM